MKHTERITCRVETASPPNPGIPLSKCEQGEPYVVLSDPDECFPTGAVVFVSYGSYIRFPGGYYGKADSRDKVMVRPLRKDEKVVIEAVGKAACS